MYTLEQVLGLNIFDLDIRVNSLYIILTYALSIVMTINVNLSQCKENLILTETPFDIVELNLVNKL